MTQETDMITEGAPTQTLDAKPLAPGENLGGDITTSLTVPISSLSPQRVATAQDPNYAPPPLIRPKEDLKTKFHEFITSVERTPTEIWAWIEKEYHKVS